METFTQGNYQKRVFLRMLVRPMIILCKRPLLSKGPTATASLNSIVCKKMLDLSPPNPLLFCLCLLVMNILRQQLSNALLYTLGYQRSFYQVEESIKAEKIGMNNDSNIFSLAITGFWHPVKRRIVYYFKPTEIK